MVSTLTVGSNTYLVSYTGGTGNDLTLTVQVASRAISDP